MLSPLVDDDETVSVWDISLSLASFVRLACGLLRGLDSLSLSEDEADEDSKLKGTGDFLLSVLGSDSKRPRRCPWVIFSLQE